MCVCVYVCKWRLYVLPVDMLAMHVGHNLQFTEQMKHYRAKPSAQLSKHLQDDIKHADMKLELE